MISAKDGVIVILITHATPIIVLSKSTGISKTQYNKYVFMITIVTKSDVRLQ